VHDRPAVKIRVKTTDSQTQGLLRKINRRFTVA
jgi:hypothetical protein